MQHNIPIEDFGPGGEPMAEAVQKCVHCGFCLPACPTYQVLGEEMDSPRGRIFLMKEVLEGGVPFDEAAPYIDRCLGCLGCVTACPSGVAYGELLTPYRAEAERRRRRSWGDRLLRWMVLTTLPRPARFRWAARFGGWARPLRRWLPGRLGSMLEMLPPRLPAAIPLAERTEAAGPRRGRVALLAGCAQQVLAPDINAATIRVLARNGVDVLLPRQQGCCGALAAHTGDQSRAARQAAQNLKAFDPQLMGEVDAIVTNAAGCGSGMQEYALWLKGTPLEAAAAALAERVIDVSVYLDRLGLKEAPWLAEPTRVAYHDACHLAHAQGVRLPPRRLLKSIEQLELVELPQAEMCCGSAGTYNLEQPEIAAQLGADKARSVLATSPAAVATGNVGCLMQLQTHLAAQNSSTPVLHTMQVLDRAYRNGRLD